MKIVVSGWPGCGATTLTLLLAKIYKLKLVRGSETFRLILKGMNLGETGADIVKAESLIQPYYGPLYDKYISTLFAESSDDLIVDSDIAGFFIPDSENLTKIFLIGSDESRRSHFITDSRAEDVDIQKERDASLREAYKMYGFDIFDQVQIREHYDILFDNSETLIAEQLFQITNKIRPLLTLEQAAEIESDYWKIGKSGLIDQLAEQNLILRGKEILQDIFKKFADEIEQLPEEVRSAIRKSIL